MQWLQVTLACTCTHVTALSNEYRDHFLVASVFGDVTWIMFTNYWFANFWTHKLEYVVSFSTNLFVDQPIESQLICNRAYLWTLRSAICSCIKRLHVPSRIRISKMARGANAKRDLRVISAGMAKHRAVLARQQSAPILDILQMALYKRPNKTWMAAWQPSLAMQVIHSMAWIQSLVVLRAQTHNGQKFRSV